MPIRLLTSGGGTTTIQPTTSASSVTLTVPSVNANVVTTGDTASVTQAMLASNIATTGPAFSAYCSATQSTSANAWTKVNFDTKEFDTASCYNTSLYRFTPNVAGYYQFNLTVYVNPLSTEGIIAFYKNGSIFRYGADMQATYTWILSASTLCYMNGTTDYMEPYMYRGTSSSVRSGTDATTNVFQGYLVRAA